MHGTGWWPIFADRSEAGRRLGAALAGLRGEAGLVVLGLPRGGLTVADAVARALHAPLDVLVVRKLGLPGQPELAIGALASGGIVVRNQQVLDEVRLQEGVLAAIVEREREVLEARERLYRGDRPAVDLRERVAVVVDDGIATGSTMRAALRAARVAGARRVVAAVPVAPAEARRELAPLVDEFVCLHTPIPFLSVGSHYREFAPPSDDAIHRLLAAAAARDPARPVGGPTARAPVEMGEVELPGRPAGPSLVASWAVPEGATGAVCFAHGSGSSRRSPRNLGVAARLNAGGLATLLLDLLSPAEEVVDRLTGHLRFDIPKLAERVGWGVDWLATVRPDLPCGVFGASTGAAAALVAAAADPQRIRAIVSRGGRPDLAGSALAAVRAPTLLIVGSLDQEVLRLNRLARQRLAGPSALAIVPGATHLFEEPGALDEVARLAAEWFQRHLRGAGSLEAPGVGGPRLTRRS